MANIRGILDYPLAWFLMHLCIVFNEMHYLQNVKSKYFLVIKIKYHVTTNQ
jgi:hypothetical protein